MSIQTEITRLQTARNTLRTKGLELGLSTGTDKLDVIASAFNGIENRGAVSATVQEGDTYTIPKGYHNGSGTVSGVAGGGNYNLQSKTATPTKMQQNVTPDSGYYGLSDVTVKPIPDQFQDVSSVTAAAGDVLATKVFVTADGSVVTGTMPNNGTVTKTLDTTTKSYTIPKGFHSGTGTVSIVTEDKTATPAKAQQVISPTAGKVLSSVTVSAIPDEYVDTEDATAAAGDIIIGKTAYVSGKKIKGTIEKYMFNGKDLKPSDNIFLLPNEGYYYGTGQISVSVEELSVTPTKQKQTFSSSDYYYHPVVVDPIPSNYVETSDATALAAEILTGKTAYVGGAKVTGTMPNNGATGGTIDGLTTTSMSIPAGYTSGGTVSLDGSIEEALAAI